MTATNVPKVPPFWFRIDLSGQGTSSTIELEGGCDPASGDSEGVSNAI